MARKPEKAPPQPPHEAEEPKDEPKDKAKELYDELRRRSSEIVIRQAFKTFGKPGQDVSVNDVTKLLDETVGLNGWDIDFAQLGDACVLCKLRVKVEGEFVSRSGIGFADPLTTEFHMKRGEAIQNAVYAAARLFGIGRDNWKSTILAAAATPAKEEPRKEPPKKPEGKKEPAPKMLADYMDEWRTKLSGVDTPEELNDAIPALKSVPRQFQGQVWEYIKNWAKRDVHQWAYDTDNKKFFDPSPPDDGVEVGEAIPF